jgi:hypothetical protein
MSVRTLGLVAAFALVVAGASLATSSRITVAPTNNSAPTIGGTTAVGSTLTAANGTWSGSAPLSFQYQWQRCDTNGATCHQIPGATSQTYVLATGDAGATLRVQVIASNADGSSTATSNASEAVSAASAPVSSAAPTLSGATTVGSTLTATPGSWNGSTPFSYVYQWQRCDTAGNNCQSIGGATAQTYQLASADAGSTLRVQVTASNAAGSSNAPSGPTGLIAAAVAPTGCPSAPTGQTVAASTVQSPARLQITLVSSSGAITNATQAFTATFRITDTCGQPVSGAQVYATAVPYRQFSIPALQTSDGSGNVTLGFNREGGFPASRSQQLMVLFVRATRPGDPVLAGISTRRLVSLRVRLNG